MSTTRHTASRTLSPVASGALLDGKCSATAVACAASTGLAGAEQPQGARTTARTGNDRRDEYEPLSLRPPLLPSRPNAAMAMVTYTTSPALRRDHRRYGTRTSSILLHPCRDKEEGSPADRASVSTGVSRCTTRVEGMASIAVTTAAAASAQRGWSSRRKRACRLSVVAVACAGDSVRPAGARQICPRSRCEGC